MKKPVENPIVKDQTSAATTLTHNESTSSLNNRKLPEQQGLDVLIEKQINEIWSHYDKDKSGSLNRSESRKFLKKTLEDLHEGERFTDDKFS